jgi:hypothetical protein
MKKRFKIPLYLLSFLLLACLVFWGLLNYTNLLEAQVNRLLNVYLQTKYSIRVQVGDISGSFWKELKVKHATIDFVEEGQEYRIAEVPLLKASYRLSNLWRKRWILDSLTIDNPKVTLRKTAEGRILAPLPGGGERTTISKTGLFDFAVGNLRITKGRFSLGSPGKMSTIDSLNFELSLVKDSDSTKLQVFSGGFSFSEKKFLLKGVEGSFLKRGDSLLISGLKVATADSKLEIGGVVGNLKGGEFVLSAKARPINLLDISRLTGVPLEGVLDLDGTAEGNLSKFAGTAALNGLFFGRGFEPVRTTYTCQDEKFIFSSISGKAFGSPINGRGVFDFSVVPEEYEFEGQLKNLSIDQIVFGSIQTDLTGEVRLQGRSTAEEEMFMQAEVNLKDGRIEQYTFSQARGTIDITATAVWFHPQFQFRYKNTGVALVGELEYEGEIDVDAWAKFGDLTDFRDQIFIKEMRGRGEAFVSLSGKTEDFDIQGEFGSDSCYAYELYSSDAKITLDVENFLTKEKGIADIRFFDGEAWTIDYDSLILRVKMEDQWYKIDSAWLGSEHLALNFWGELDATKTPQTLLIYQMILDYQGNRLQSSSPAVVTIDTHQVEITKWVLSGKQGQIEASGDIDYEERMDLSVNVSAFDVAPWAGLLSSEPVQGILNCTALLGGDFVNPQIDLEADLQQLKFRDMDLGHLEATASYQDKSIHIDNLLVSDEDWEYTLTGFLPLDLSFGAVEDRVLEIPQNLTFSAKGRELEAIKLFIPEIEYLRGNFEGRLDITGSLLHPQFDGSMALSNGDLKFVQLADPVEQLRARVRMKNEYLFLDEASGVMKHGRRASAFTKMWRALSQKKKVTGAVSGFGTINLRDVRNVEYDLRFEGKDIPIDYEYADLSATADAGVRIVGRSPPLVSAEVSLSELFYREPFSSSGSGAFSYSPQMAEELWDWNLDVSVANNCWIINDDVNLEFKGDVLVVRDAGELTILGNMETIRGTYFLYGTKFKIDKGSFFFDNLERIDPSIDFLVSTRLWGASAGPSGESNLLRTGSSNEIRLAIEGTLSEPEVKPAPGSPYSSEDVIELLAFQRGLGAVDSAGMGSLFQERVIKSLGGAYGSRFLESIAGQTLGVETFEIVPTWSERFRLTDAQITIGKYLSDKVYLRYTRRLSQSSGQETGVEYRLNKHLLLEGRKDKLGLFHLGLNLNWEY